MEVIWDSCSLRKVRTGLTRGIRDGSESFFGGLRAKFGIAMNLADKNAA